ncbi:MAG TPA: allantoinase AllB, partial [Candidatus Acidoferrales bacterium]|nr:allantoinase AllB [Candidatus Acidoferrales bacterium]
MSAPQQIIRGRRVVLPDAIRPAAIHIRDGVVAAISDFNDLPFGCPIFEAGDSVVMPGLVDTHVHINEPGRTEWEGFETATRAAAAGGVTTLIEMPLNSVPATTSAAAFGEKLIAAREKLHVDVGFWGGVVPGNAAEIAPLWDAGVFGFKSFLVPSGVEEFCHVAESDLRKAWPVLRSIRAPLLVHAELPGPIESASPAAARIPPERYAAWLASRPSAAEDEAIALLIRLQREFAARIHVVHLSSASAIPLVRQAKKDGLPLTAETCPHYLCFTADEIPDGATEYKCAPPIRDRSNREALWSALGEGVI